MTKAQENAEKIRKAGVCVYIYIYIELSMDQIHERLRKLMNASCLSGWRSSLSSYLFLLFLRCKAIWKIMIRHKLTGLPVNVLVAVDDVKVLVKVVVNVLVAPRDIKELHSGGLEVPCLGNTTSQLILCETKTFFYGKRKDFPTFSFSGTGGFKLGRLMICKAGALVPVEVRVVVALVEVTGALGGLLLKTNCQAI